MSKSVSTDLIAANELADQLNVKLANILKQSQAIAKLKDDLPRLEDIDDMIGSLHAVISLCGQVTLAWEQTPSQDELNDWLGTMRESVDRLNSLDPSDE